MGAVVGVTFIFYSIILPISLVASVLFRYNALSAIYLIFLLFYPFSPKLSPQTIITVSVPSTSVIFDNYTKDSIHTIHNHTLTAANCKLSLVISPESWNLNSLVLLIMSTIFVLAHVGFQIALLVNKPYGSVVEPFCSDLESLCRYLGFEKLQSSDIASVFRLLMPDVGIFLVALCCFIFTRKTRNFYNNQQLTQLQTQGEANSLYENEATTKKQHQAHLRNGGILVFTVIFLALSGIAYPGVISSIYLLSFLILTIMWAVHQPLLISCVAVFRACISAICMVHLFLLYVYQMQFMQQLIPPDHLLARLFGLTAIISTDCQAPYKLLVFDGLPWTIFVSPGIILILQFLLGIGVRMYFEDSQILASKAKGKSIAKQKSLGERRPLVNNEELPQNYESLQPSHESVQETPSTSQQFTTLDNQLDADGHSQINQDKKSISQNSYFLQSVENWLTDVKHFSFYVLALIIMMVWSVTYHSWLTFVLLLWSCVLWMTKHRSWFTLLCSPILTFYGMCLILLQFIYGLDLNDTELPVNVTLNTGYVLHLDAFGLVKYPYPCLPLGAQILYYCGFLLVFHQYIYIRAHRPYEDDGEIDTETWANKLAAFFTGLFSRYWIFVVVAFHLGLCTQGYPTGIKIIYMAFLSLNLITYVFSWPFWRVSLHLYLLTLVAYTMLVLIIIYTYQFQDFPNFWMSFTHFSNQQLEDLGLVQYDGAGALLVNILVPTLFLLSVILQLNYFNKTFLEMTKQPTVVSRPTSNNQLTHADREQADNEVMEMDELQTSASPKKKKSCCKKMLEDYLPVLLEGWELLKSFILQGLEFHMWRLLYITVFVAAAYQVSLIYAFLMLLWLLLIPFRRLQPLLFLFTMVFVLVFTLGIMFYQLSFVKPGVNLDYNCTYDFYGRNETNSSDLLTWIGFVKMPKDGQFFYHIEGFVFIALMLGLNKTVTLRQNWRRIRHDQPRQKLSIFYPAATIEQIDNGLSDCAKYFVNFFFYKFGVEACFVMSVITIWIRLDVYATVYAVLLIIAMLLKTRAALYRYWRVYVVLLMLILVWEYLICVGMPPFWCVDDNYPWLILGSNVLVRDRLVRWLYLPDYVVPPDSTELVADFFQLLFVVGQLFVFEKEPQMLKIAGDNKYLTPAMLDEITLATNPKKNFTLRKSRSLLDQLKVFVFNYMLWITMACVFFAGTARISLFCLGYLISFFYLLSRQQTLLMGKPSTLLKVWNIILGYNVAVITLKAALQIASCVYIDVLGENACGFVQLMSLVCSQSDKYLLPDKIEKCEIDYGNAGLTWDFICFLFLLIQRRIFMSYYFFYVAEDMRISIQLAARGAELFHIKLIEEVQEREKQEQESLSAIKKSMLSIKKRYSELRKGLLPSVTHVQATRAGGYYMFDDDSEVKDIAKKPDEIMDPLNLIHKAETEGIDEALKERDLDKKKLSESELVVEETEKTETDGITEVDHRRIHEEVESKKADEKVEEKSIADKMKSFFLFLFELFMSLIDFITLKLNQINCNYRNISIQLSYEKDQLSSKKFQQQQPSRVAFQIEDENNVENNQNQDTTEDHETSGNKSLIKSTSQSSTEEWFELKAIEFDKDQHRPLRLFYAVWYSIISRTDVVCYFLFILNLMLSASVMSLVLPILVFMWGTFCIPRPSKTFWIFCIIYLQIVIVLKFFFQFEFFPWNSEASKNFYENSPFWWPRILGIEQTANWMVMNLLQLFAVLFHVSILKVHGIWDSNENYCENEQSIDENMEEPLAIKDIPSTSEQAEAKDTTSIKTTTSTKTKPENAEEDLVVGFADKAWAILKAPYMLYSNVFHQKFNAVTDVYIYILLCDVINFIIIIFGYSAFGAYSAQSSVVSDLQSNNVPTGFLVMLLIQFAMMFIDRALYLRKNLLGKFIFQIVLIVGIHIWMFFILPSINNRPFFNNHVAQTWYFFKALYFLLSAYQIRAGYPSRVVGSFLTKSYGTVNLFLFKGYRIIPFLAELTAIMDWMYSATSMALGEWMKLWSIHAEVFELKGWRVFEAEYPTQRGQAKKIYIKYLMGGALVFILIFILWFPLLLMNIALTIGGVPNNPTQVDVKVSLGAFEPIFQVVSDQNQIQNWNPAEYKNFALQYANDSDAAGFLSGFGSSEVVTVTIDGQSKTTWAISPPQLIQLAERLNSSNPSNIALRFEWVLTKDNPDSIMQATGFNEQILKPQDPVRSQLFEIINNSSQSNVILSYLYPRFILSPGSTNTAYPVRSLLPSITDYTNVSVSLKQGEGVSWWELAESGSNSLSLTIFSNKVSPSSLSFLVSYGIIGLYVSVVLVVGRLVRSIFGGSTPTIMFNELPYVDRILQLCNDIFLVREEEEYELEEDLYAKLIFLYRSPETLIKWTKSKID